MRKQEDKRMDIVNEHILNIISPPGIDYDDTHANLGECYGKIYTISKYPKSADYGWLAPLCNLEGTSTQVEYKYTDSGNMVEVFNHKVDELKGEYDVAKTESEKQKIVKAISDLKKMIQKVSIEDEPIGYVNILMHVQANSSKELEKRVKKVSASVSTIGCNLMNLRYKQLQALECIAPYGIPNEVVSNMGSRNMPISTFIGGFPMASPGINDIGGYYLGKTKSGKIIILNMWIRNKDRVNSNWFISGLPGSGKSTALKLIFLKELAFGTVIIISDPEEEYVDFARDPNINGEVVDCGGGANGRINPLQLRYTPRVTEEDLDEGESINEYMIYDESEGISDLAFHIQNLRVFFKLYFGKEEYTPGIRAKLEMCLIELYEKYGITWDTDIKDIKNEDYPFMENLYDLVDEKSKDERNSDYDNEVYARLKDLLYPAGKGADKYLWNGPTTLNPKSNFIVLNTSKMQELEDNVKNAQDMNITTWVWNRSAQDRTEKVLYGVDEGYLSVDPDHPDLAKFLRNYSKRDRKYEAGLMFITHSVVDILDPEIKRLGQAIIDNSCYKFIMGCDGKNLKETAALFDLTEKEINILSARSRGQGILFAGNVRMEVTIDVREKFLDMFGKAGGR